MHFYSRGGCSLWILFWLSNNVVQFLLVFHNLAHNSHSIPENKFYVTVILHTVNIKFPMLNYHSFQMLSWWSKGICKRGQCYCYEQKLVDKVYLSYIQYHIRGSTKTLSKYTRVYLANTDIQQQKQNSSLASLAAVLPSKIPVCE